MGRTRIVSATAAALMLGVCTAPSGASAASTLLSGYGGPGAGEQMIIGSTFLGKPSATTSNGSRSSVVSGATSSVPRISGGRYGAATPGAAQGAGSNGTRGGGANASGNGKPAGPPAGRSPLAASAGSFVYPSALRSASAKSTVLGLTGGELVALGAVVTGLAAVGALTIRLGRLQR